MPLPTAYGTIPLGGALPEAYVPGEAIPLLGGALESGYGEVSYAVNMTAAASGSNGITVADDDDIDFGTGDFFLHWEGSLPDWTPATTQTLLRKFVSAGYLTTLTSAGLFRVQIVTGTTYASTAPVAITDGANAKLTAVIVRETASTAGSVVFYANGIQLGASVAIAAASPATINNSDPLYISGTSTARTASNTISCIVGNFAPTASEVLALCTNGIPESWKWGSQTAQTSGTLTVGSTYRINTYVAGDDFTNVGAASNASGVRFTATGTTPTTWTNSSSLVRIGATMALLPDTIPTSSATTWSDTSGNTGGGTLPAAGATKVTIRR